MKGIALGGLALAALFASDAVAQQNAEGLMGRAVYGPDGRQLGAVSDLHVTPDGRVFQIVVGDSPLDEAALALRWDEARVTVDQVRAENLLSLQREFAGPVVDGWSYSALEGAQVQLGDRPEWGEVHDLLIDPAGRVTGYVVAGGGQGLLVVPPEAAQVGPDGGYLKVTIPEAQVSQLPRLETGLNEPALPPLGTAPDVAAAPAKERLEAQIRQEVEEWQRRVAAFAHSGAAPQESEDLQHAFRAVQLHYQNLRQVRDDNFETVLEKYRAAEEQLAQAWDEVQR